ncbi:MAG TPA: glycosyltransferase family 39 protein [Candidatus Tectomicrobia bacterium]|nr:glycosyltransferase family 39 protein [Candidatus Tectomicrobia bacterium]
MGCKADRWAIWSLGSFLLVVTTVRLWYLQQGYLELAPDEAHYWEWSRRLDWSYYSKGPFVAYLIALSTALGGATELFVRLPAVLLSAGTTICVFGLFKALFDDARLALATAISLHVIPLFAAGALLMTIDPPLVFFWTLMLWLVYAAMSADRPLFWYAAGGALACGLLSKYAMVYAVMSVWLFLATSRCYRSWLRRKEPYLMLAIGLAGFTPVIIWNLRHDVVSLKHVMGQAIGHQGVLWHVSLETFGEFLGSQALALSPLLFGSVLIAMAMSLWEGRQQRDDRWLFLFWGWAPTFFLMLSLSLRQKVQANWAAPGYITAFMATTAYAAHRWQALPQGLLRRLGLAGAGLMIMLALSMTVALHVPTLFVRLGLQPSADPVARLKGWRALASAVESVVVQMPRPPFVLSDRYQISSELAFYVAGQPYTYNVNLGRRLNQYDLWDGLSTLVGHDAIYVQPESADLPQALRAAFHTCDAGKPVIIEELGRELKRFYLFQCQGFSGVPPRPDQVRY